MPTLLFEGYSDDTFGEYRYTNDDYDNCASGEPIEYLVEDPATGNGIIVSGQHCPGSCTSWMIGVGCYQPSSENECFPEWRMSNHFNGRCYSLVIEAPEGVVVRCLTRERAAG